MKYYFAPIEGTTDDIFIKAHSKYFAGVDKYFTPFLSPTKDGILSNRDKRLVNKNNYENVNVVPQILSKNSADTVLMIKALKDMGYGEINLNFGCPYPTVTSKGKGSGFLKNLDELGKYLSDIFNSEQNIKISIKTRIGFDSETEFVNILNVFMKYPLSELIIHPRTRNEFYKGRLHFEAIDLAIEKAQFPIIYNGDINTLNDIKQIENRFKNISGVMIGRGFLKNPGLIVRDSMSYNDLLNNYKDFHNEIMNEHQKRIGWNGTLFYMKDYWSYFNKIFIDDKNLYKDLTKTKDGISFKNVTEIIFNVLKLNI